MEKTLIYAAEEEPKISGTQFSTSSKYLPI